MRLNAIILYITMYIISTSLLHTLYSASFYINNFTNCTPFKLFGVQGGNNGECNTSNLNKLLLLGDVSDDTQIPSTAPDAYKNYRGQYQRLHIQDSQNWSAIAYSSVVPELEYPPASFSDSASADVGKTCNGPWVSCRIPCKQWYQYFDVKLNADLTVSITWLPNKASGTCAG